MSTHDNSSTPSGQAIKPLNFEAPDASNEVKPTQQGTVAIDSVVLTTRAGAPWWQSQLNLMLCVFGLLVVAAGLFVVLTPPPNVDTVNTVIDTDGSIRETSGTISQEAAPWDESRRAQARTDSQEVLADLLAIKKDLERKEVQQWAPQRFDAALALAAQGDEFYKRQDFAEAIKSYRSALTEMESVTALIPDVLASKIAAGQAAIKDGKTALARSNFEAALSLDKNSIAALRGLDRVKTLDQVLGVVRSAAMDEQEFQRTDELSYLADAEQKYIQALALDPDLDLAKQGLTRVRENTADKQFRTSMSKGFNALFERRYPTAKSAFSAALKIRPNDATANGAYQQSLASDKRASISSLLATAKRFEANEQWANAVSNYQAVLQRDANQVSAKLGQIRSRARRELDVELDALLQDTLALSRDSQRQRASRALADARAIKTKGARLADQIARVDAALQQMEITVKVSFVSDAQTDITLSKAGSNKLRLGKFTTKNLALKPGRYVVTGMRLGFHDVRQEIELRAGGGDVQTFSIACDQPIARNTSVTRSQ